MFVSDVSNVDQSGVVPHSKATVPPADRAGTQKMIRMVVQT